MEETNQRRIFLIEGKKYHFNKQAFIEFFNKECKPNKENKRLAKSKLEKQIATAEGICVSPNTVHAWRFGKCGPSDLDMIKVIAKIFNIKDYKVLLEEKGEETEEMATMNDRIDSVTKKLQLESIKRVYDAIINFLDEFDRTDGFTGTLWYEFVEKGVRDPEEELYYYADGQLDKVRLVLKREYFYLHNDSIYEELENFIEEDLYDTYNEKLEYAYRYEAKSENSPTSTEDYEKALQKINGIIANCI
jgi:transcriptional regulator with XRE-family HTH domain